MVSFNYPKYRYLVDARDLISYVSPAWLAFARENGARELTQQAVIGHSLWDFIADKETVRLYQAILDRIRAGTPSVLVPFRCDSPTLRRYMRLEIVGRPDGGIQFDGIMEKVEPTRRLNLLDPGFPRSLDVLTICSCCKRALVEPHGWLDIEDATVRLQLLEKSRSPQLRNAICPNCLAAAARAS